MVRMVRMITWIYMSEILCTVIVCTKIEYTGHAYMTGLMIFCRVRISQDDNFCFRKTESSRNFKKSVRSHNSKQF